MQRLDCSSPASTAASLSTIFGVEPAEVECRCRALDLASHGDRSPIESLFGRPSPYDLLEVVYFHATRAFPSRRSFPEGLRPLGAAIDELWADLYNLTGDECDLATWAQFRTWVERGEVPYPAYVLSNEPGLTMLEQFKRNLGDVETQRARELYRMIMDYRERLRAPERWGPGGFLIRQVALSTAAEAISGELGHPLPIVEDIAAAYEERFHRDLLAAYREAAQPCVVKFYDVRSAVGSVEVAARYLCQSVQQREVYSLVSFDGGARPVPPERILGVEVSPAS